MSIATSAQVGWSISVREVHKRYGENVLFRSLSFSITPGRALRIVGPNGSGKTQLLYALCGLVQFDQGEIALNGDRKALVPSSVYLRDKVFRFVPATPSDLSQLTVEEFVHVLSRSLRPYSLAPRSRAVLTSFGRFRSELERATGRTLDQGLPVSKLSIGQQKRLMLAATIFCEEPPKVLAIDEPLAALDATGIEEMLNLLLSARNRSIALVIAEHRREIGALKFDEVIAMPYGVAGDNCGPVERNTCPDSGLPPQRICLSLDNVQAGYPGRLLHCEHLEIPVGGVAIISGENGSGKTGLVKAIAGIAPTRLTGQLQFDGKTVHDLGLLMRQFRVRYMAQNRDNFLQLTVADAFAAACPPSSDCSRFEDLIASIGKRKRVSDLSSGNRALLSLAQCLAAHPQLALLDEPFANVDAANRRQMAAHIQEARRQFGTAFLIVEHGDMDLPWAARYTVRDDEDHVRLRPEHRTGIELADR